LARNRRIYARDIFRMSLSHVVSLMFIKCFCYAI
jgi:hypothetical protein